VTDREKMEGYCSTGQRPQRAVVPVEEEEDIFIYNALERKWKEMDLG
jgi:hypothetical protein